MLATIEQTVMTFNINMHGAKTLDQIEFDQLTSCYANSMSNFTRTLMVVDMSETLQLMPKTIKMDKQHRRQEGCILIFFFIMYLCKCDLSL